MNKYYILYNGKVWLSDTKIPSTKIAVNEDYAKSEALKYHYQELYSRWKQNLKPCEINDSELGLVIGQCTMR
jgi:hypothetical protein